VLFCSPHPHVTHTGPELTVRACDAPLIPLKPVPPADACGASAELRVLRTLPLRMLRTKLARALKLTTPTRAAAPAASLRVWMRMPDGRAVELEQARDAHDLEWLGVDDGTELYVAAEV
jgi:hypothetical protein